MHSGFVLDKMKTQKQHILTKQKLSNNDTQQLVEYRKISIWSMK